MLKVRSLHSIHSLLKSKRLATYNYMQRMRDNNLEIRIAGFSCHPWLSLVYKIQTCQYILANSLWVKLMHEIFVLLWQEFLKTSQLVKQFSEDFQTLPKNVWSCSDNLWAILKLFQVSKGNWIEFLSLIMCWRTIHRICLWGMRNWPCWWVKSRSRNKFPGMKLMHNVLELAGILLL